jgi:hypothetical protein
MPVVVAHRRDFHANIVKRTAQDLSGNKLTMFLLITDILFACDSSIMPDFRRCRQLGDFNLPPF